MKLSVDMVAKIDVAGVNKAVDKATKKALVSVIADIANDAIQNSPVLTGNNRRSIKFEVGPNQPIATKDGQGAVYSTSGYGGYLETGTVKMAPRPYMRPALDKNIGKLPSKLKAELK